jgi:hypothetical protein
MRQERQTSQTREKAKREREQARDGNSEPCVARLKLHGISNSFCSRGWKEGRRGEKKKKEGREGKFWGRWRVVGP